MAAGSAALAALPLCLESRSTRCISINIRVLFTLVTEGTREFWFSIDRMILTGENVNVMVSGVPEIWCLDVMLPGQTFLGPFAKLRNGTVSFVVCLNVRMEQLGYYWTDMHEI